jgi:hypothetical protein
MARHRIRRASRHASVDASLSTAVVLHHPEGDE